MSYSSPATRREYDAKYRADHRAEINAYFRTWARANRDLLLMYRRLRYYALGDGRHQPLQPEDHVDWCDDCGVRHTIEQRAALLRRLLPSSVHTIREAYSHIWGLPSDDDAGARKLYRDLKRIGAIRTGKWGLPSVDDRPLDRIGAIATAEGDFGFGVGVVWYLPRRAA